MSTAATMLSPTTTATIVDAVAAASTATSIPGQQEEQDNNNDDLPVQVDVSGKRFNNNEYKEGLLLSNVSTTSRKRRIVVDCLEPRYDTSVVVSDDVSTTTTSTMPSPSSTSAAASCGSNNLGYEKPYEILQGNNTCKRRRRFHRRNSQTAAMLFSAMIPTAATSNTSSDNDKDIGHLSSSSLLITGEEKYDHQNMYANEMKTARDIVNLLLQSRSKRTRNECQDNKESCSKQA